MPHTLPAASDRFVGYGQPRAVACVIRDFRTASRLLVLKHPDEGFQIPKGRIDQGETPREAAIRELAEESGMELKPTRFLRELSQRFTHPGTGEPVDEEWHCWLFEAPHDVPESWTHIPDEEGIPFIYSWLPLDAAGSVVLSYLHDVIRLIEYASTD